MGPRCNQKKSAGLVWGEGGRGAVWTLQGGTLRVHQIFRGHRDGIPRLPGPPRERRSVERSLKDQLKDPSADLNCWGDYRRWLWYRASRRAIYKEKGGP